LTLARYLVRRLRPQFTELPIVVGHWGDQGSANALERLKETGASRIVTTLADARVQILGAVVSEPKVEGVATALPA
jgi:hypothetical protein